MSEISDMIQRLCPDGVEYRKIKDVVKSISTGLNPRKNFKLNTSDSDNYYVTVKEFTSGKIIFNDKTDRISDEAVSIIQNRSKLEYNDILLSGIGTIGKVALVNIPVGNWNCSESVFLLKPIIDIIQPKFLVYILQGNEVQNVWINECVGSTLKGIRKTTLENLEIPVPPLEVQRKIVEMLDNFSELTAELTAELEARKKQYEYYRDNLLNFSQIAPPNSVKWMKLGDVGMFIRGNGIQKKDFQDSGVGCIHYGQIHTHYHTFTDVTISFISKELAKKSKKARYGDLIIATTSEDAEGVCKAVAWLGNEEIAISGDAFIFRHTLNPKYVAYLFQTSRFLEHKIQYSTGAKVVRMSAENMAKFLIPIPPLPEQERIVSILDRFEALTTDLTSGLPAEIKARQQQYEYYRDQLLTFKRAN